MGGQSSGCAGGTFVASVVFGAVHLGNAFLGQSASSADGEAVFALAFAFALGWYYERTQDLAGAAWIHNATDGLGTLAAFVMSVL
ncbi:MAG: CPBP family intramembrane metalloprotease [Nitrososphaerota archaeon]|nr:CPBP family intramembrane metalloprotease [Nitrososphaerota archaeon]